VVLKTRGAIKGRGPHVDRVVLNSDIVGHNTQC
jgi:hypothetical protein